jgi:serine phosphatase RsbU (regulator of sigma subunit)
MIQIRFNHLKNAYKNITNGMSFEEWQKLLRKDVPEVYSFYVNRMQKPVTTGKSLRDKIAFIKNLFNGFLQQLSPARRIIYIFSLGFFIGAFFYNDWQVALFAFILLNLLLAFELANKITSNDELKVARDVQNSLLPKSPPENDNYDISCYSETAKSVGGDYYDFIVKNDELIIAIGDISGKGMGAAIHMVQVQAIIRNLLDSHFSPKTILLHLNNNLNKLFRPGIFFTINLASVNTDGNIQFCRAGHLPIVHFCPLTGDCHNHTPKGIGIGLSKNGLFENTLEEITISPEKGDILVFFTDGITEAMNNYLMEYGEDRLNTVIKNNASKDSSGIKSAIISSIKSFTTTAPVNDDLTLIVLKKY